MLAGPKLLDSKQLPNHLFHSLWNKLIRLTQTLFITAQHPDILFSSWLGNYWVDELNILLSASLLLLKVVARMSEPESQGTPC